MGAQAEVTEESMLKALSELEENILKAEATSEDTSEESSSEEKSTKKSHVREDRDPPKSLPRTNREATASLDDDAGTGEVADMEAGKSFRDGARGNQSIRKGMDASPFLEGLIDNMSEEADGVRKSVLFLQKSLAETAEDQSTFNRQMTKAIVQMGNLISEQHEMIKSLGGRPAGVRKSVTVQGEVQERFQKSDDFQFDKPTVLRKCVEMVEKGMLPGLAAIEYESSGSMSQSVQKAVYAELQKSAR